MPQHPSKKISNVNQLPNFVASGGTEPLPIDTEKIMNNLLGNKSIFNSNVKKLSPDGGVEFFDDGELINALNARPPKPQSQIAQTPLEPFPDIGGVPPEGGGFSNFITSPKFRQLLAEFGGAISASRPRSFANQISQFAQGSIEAEIFNTALQGLIGGQEENPSGGGISGDLALLPPEMQLAVIQQAQAIKAQERGDESADIGDALNAANTLKALRPEVDKTKPSSRVETFKTLPNGRTAPSGKLFRMGFNNNTGNFDIFQGIIDEDKEKEGDKLTVKTSELKSLQENVIATFNDELIEGIEKRFGTKLANAGQLLNFLRTGEGDFDMGTARVALAEFPDALNDFNDLVAKGTSRLLGDETPDIGDIIRDLSAERLGRVRTKNTMLGIPTSQEAEKK